MHAPSASQQPTLSTSNTLSPSQPPQDSSHTAAISITQMPSAPQPELQDDGHPPLNRTRIPKKNNGRYSFKQRTRKKLHPPPPVMKQFYRKPYKQTLTKPTTTTPDKPTTNKPKNIKAPMYTKKPTESLDKNNVVRCLSWYHPTSTLDVGTLAANTKEYSASGLRPPTSKPPLPPPLLSAPQHPQ